MEQSPTFKSNLNSEMSDLVHQAEEWAQIIPHDSPTQNPRLEEIFKQILYKSSLIILEKSGVKTVEEFQKLFGSMIVEKEEFEKDVIEVQRQGAVSSLSLEDLQSYLKKDWTELLEEPLPSFSPYNCRRRTSLFSDLNLMSPIVSEASKSPEKIKLTPSTLTPSRFSRKPLFSSMSTPKTPWRRGNSMYVEDVVNQTMGVTPQRSLSTSRLNRHSPAPMADETPLENRASRLRRMKMEEKIRESRL